jgi:hypothetical protein
MYHRTHKIRWEKLIVGHLNSVKNLAPYVDKIYISIILASVSISLKWLLHFRFPDQYLCINFSFISSKLHVPPIPSFINELDYHKTVLKYVLKWARDEGSRRRSGLVCKARACIPCIVALPGRQPIWFSFGTLLTVNIISINHSKKKIQQTREMKSAVFLDVAPCRYFVNRRFGGTYRLHVHHVLFHQQTECLKPQSGMQRPTPFIFSTEVTSCQREGCMRKHSSLSLYVFY